MYNITIDNNKCKICGNCVTQCPRGVYSKNDKILIDSKNCVNCRRCAEKCPFGAITIDKDRHTHCDQQFIDIKQQSKSGGIILAAGGKPVEPYFNKLLLNAAQVVCPSVDPLREPIETKTVIGKKCDDAPLIELSMPLIFGGMSYGALSLNAHKALARAASQNGILYNSGKAVSIPNCTNTQAAPLCS